MKSLSNSYFSVAELIEKQLSSLPKTTKGILAKAKRENWECRKREGKGGGKEYAFDSLPAEVQAEVILKMTVEYAPKPSEPSRRDLIIAHRDVLKINQKHKDIADARCAMVVYHRQVMEQEGLTSGKAVSEVSRRSQAGELPDAIAKMAHLAVAKHRKRQGFGKRVLWEWIKAYNSARTPNEKLTALAPIATGLKTVSPDEIPWLADFMVVYRNKNGITVAEAYRQFRQQWGAKHGIIDGCPSFHQVEYALKKLPKHIKEIGRKTGAEIRALKTYVKRDWSTLQPNDVWCGDGHSMKMKVQHPEHGQPFTPELTLIMDTASRFIVGWSLSFSESTIAVADALRFGMSQHGIPAMYYSDNGGGQKNKTFDADLTGIFPRLGIHHETGIPGNPQGRGIIERANKTIAHRIAQQFKTYYGPGADKETVRKTLTGVASLQKAIKDGKTDLTPKQKGAIGKLPTWQQLLDEIAAGVDWYNNEHQHSEIGNVTPADMRYWLLNQPNCDPLVRISSPEARELFRPQFVRKVQRGWLSLLNNNYWHQDLEDYDGVDVVVAVDIHDANTVIIREKITGDWICDAVFDGNKRDAFAKTLVDKAKSDRAKAAKKRVGEKIERIEGELTPTLEVTDYMVIEPKPVRQEKHYDFLGVTPKNKS